MYYLLKLLSWLPLWVLYGISDFFYFVAFYLVRWRRDIASENIARSFPEKSEQERYTIMRHSYRNLGFTAAETIWSARQSADTIREHVQVDNMELVNEFLDRGSSVLLMGAHFANWEWIVQAMAVRMSCTIATVYKPQRLSGADRFLKEVRSHLGKTLLIPHTDYAKEVAAHRREQRAYGLVADQTPLRREQKYWTTFLNQETPFFLGTDRLAHILNAPVFYPALRRVRRGYYRIHFELLSAPPYDKKAKQENAITAAYAACLEREIRKTPGEWLWLHRKWKYERTSATE